MKHMTTNGFDECYTGTGPAAEVIGCRFAPGFYELLAQRDELAAALECVLRDHLAVHGVGDMEMQPSLFQARAALSRIKGA
jgi:hypothetical protein